jgi:branched-chain amino acid transport system substrate-binding protein
VESGMKSVRVSLLCAMMLYLGGANAQQPPVKIVGLFELSGNGATAGTNFKNGADLAFKEINASGGILGRKVEFTIFDTQTSPQLAKDLSQKAQGMGAYVVMGPVFSGSIMASMGETQRAEIPNFTGGEAAAITRQFNPYVFRTSFTQDLAMPKVANYLRDILGAKSVAVMFINNDFGKGGRDAIVKALKERRIAVAADISTEPGQIDYSGAVLKAKQANADVLFVYLNEEESARALRELRKQGYDKPIIGETTLIGQKVIDSAGEAANGIRGHVGLTVDAPIPAVRAFSYRFEREYKYKSDHNGMKGYFGAYVIKAVTEQVGKFDRKAFAQAMKGVVLSTKKTPGLLMDVTYDDYGDLDRDSFLVEVRNGQQVVVATMPPLGGRFIELPGGKLVQLGSKEAREAVLNQPKPKAAAPKPKAKKPAPAQAAQPAPQSQ